MAVKIHPTAIVHKNAELADGVEIGAYSVIGERVAIDEKTWVGPHVVIEGRTKIGKHNRIFQFCSLGGIPQDKKYRGEDSSLIIGSHNTIREYCTFNIGTEGDKNQTCIGSHNWLMAYVHLAHDCTVGDHTTFSNGASLAGHVVIEDHVNLGGFTLVNQWCRIGESVFTAASSLIQKDVLPYLTAKGNPAGSCGVNKKNLTARGVHKDAMDALEKAYKYHCRESSKYSKESIEKDAGRYPEVRYFLNFLSTRKKAGKKKRGIIMPLSRCSEENQA